MSQPVALPAPGGRVLADLVVPRRSRALARVSDVALVAVGVALVAVSAQAAIPFWPVPLTLQTFAVLLVGTALGPLRGSVALGAYLVLGVAGLPIFSEQRSGSLFALTSGGYIVGFVFAAALVGALARLRWDRRVVGMLATFAAGMVAVYAVGLPWLAVSLASLGPAVWRDTLGYDTLLAATIGAGLTPFLVGDLVKAAAAAVLLPLAWRGVRAVDSRT